VRINGRPAIAKDDGIEGDRHRFSVRVDFREARAAVRVTVREGSDVYRTIERAPAGATNRGLRILRSRAGDEGLLLRVEGLAGRREVVRLTSPRKLAGNLPAGVRLVPGPGDPALEIAFDGSPGDYVRRDLTLPLTAAAARR
jgi:hypothetical protein